jgi:2-aminoadipate transaminase
MSTSQLPPFSDGMKNIPESFIREILKVSSQPETISFAGGLPNPAFFPADKLAVAAEKVLQKTGTSALQYWITEGYLPLRDYIADWQSRRMGKKIYAEDILVLTGSQQGLDLAGKMFLNPASSVLLEGPSYLGAIQAFSAYQPEFSHIKIYEGGPDPFLFNELMRTLKPVLFYCIPNFQNPTGNTHDNLHRNQMAAIGRSSETAWVEDNPYGEIYFEEDNPPDFYSLIPEKTIYLGSFSKIVSPGLRLGWAMGPRQVIKKMAVAKQASDLHSNTLAQRIIYQFLLDNSLDDHLSSIRTSYKSQAELMITAMRQYFPEEVKWITPKGGMFIWATLPACIDANLLLKKAIAENVLFVPGDNFYVGGKHGGNCLRINFSNPTREEITKGIRILGKLIFHMMDDGGKDDSYPKPDRMHSSTGE